jgi:hypothetical protein
MSLSTGTAAVPTLTGMKNMFRNLTPDSHDPARRKLLRNTTLILAFLTTSARGLLARPLADNGELAGNHVTQTLRQLARRLFPHNHLPGAPYGEIASALVRRASTNTEFAEILYAGVVQLDSGSATSWLRQGEAQQLAAINQIEGDEFFRLMRTTTIEHLYRDKDVWKLLGYEGSSVEFGGYVDRGFDDIDWLPDLGNSR